MTTYKQHIANGSECLADAAIESARLAGFYEINHAKEIAEEKERYFIKKMEDAEDKGFSWNNVETIGFSGEFFAGWYLSKTGKMPSAIRSEFYKKNTFGKFDLI